jgi:formimidoylglutamate deiminase
MTTFLFEHALLADGWASGVEIAVDASGSIHTITQGKSMRGVRSRGRIAGAAIPGAANTHSHSFQRAMAGLGEMRSLASRDSFWTWRERMYQLVDCVDPGDYRAIAAQLFVELLRGGYTGVVEFHYLHRAARGKRFADPNTMALALAAAALDTGIALTLTPVLYQQGGFRGRPLHGGQRRFGLSLDGYLAGLDDLAGHLAREPNIHLAMGVHSLRAVRPAVIRELLAARSRDFAGLPFHIHVAEQPAEVTACQAALGAAPMRWILDNAEVDAHWCMVHGTQATASELAALRRADGRLSVCPSTEGNLGDGIPRLRKFISHGGAITIGTDSNVCRVAAEELRWLEYGQRLASGERLICAAGRTQGSGTALWQSAAAASASITGRAAGVLAVGQKADLCVLELTESALLGGSLDTLLDRFVFASSASAVRDVMVGGRWVIQDRRHSAEAAILRRYSRALQRIARLA